RGNGPAVVQAISTIPPLTTLRVAYKIAGDAPTSDEPTVVKVELLSADGSTVLQTNDVQLGTANPRDPLKPYRQTFVSQIDGSVQYYAVKQAATREGDPPPAMVLTLHGASVE